MHTMPMGAGFNVLNDLSLKDLRPISAAAKSGDVAVSFRGPPNSPISHSAALSRPASIFRIVPNSAKAASYHSDGRGLRLGVHMKLSHWRKTLGDTVRLSRSVRHELGSPGVTAIPTAGWHNACFGAQNESECEGSLFCPVRWGFLPPFRKTLPLSINRFRRVSPFEKRIFSIHTLADSLQRPPATAATQACSYVS